MASGLEKSTRIKLLIIFGLFIGLIIGLIVYEVHAYIKAKQQRENFENLRHVEQNLLKVTPDSEVDESPEAEEDSVADEAESEPEEVE